MSFAQQARSNGGERARQDVAIASMVGSTSEIATLGARLDAAVNGLDKAYTELEGRLALVLRHDFTPGDLGHVSNGAGDSPEVEPLSPLGRALLANIHHIEQLTRRICNGTSNALTI